MNDEVEKPSKKKIITGLVWTFGERFLAQFVSFVISIILARLLTPDDYGIVAIVMVFMGLADVFVSSGFSTALIQKKDANETDFSSMFYCSFICSIVIYIIIFFAAPMIAQIYNTPSLVNITRVFALRIPISAYNSIQHAYVSRHMMFKKFFFSTFYGTILSGIVGVTLAYCGYGVWALIAQYFSNTIIDTIVLSFTVPWHPKLLFNWKSSKGMMKFGTKILLANLSGSFFGHLRTLVIGGVYSSADLAFYDKGGKFPQLLTSNLTTAVSTVLFPAMSTESDSFDNVKQMSLKFSGMMGYVIFPLLAGLAATSNNFIPLLITEKWNPSILFVKIFCLDCAIGIMSITSLETLKAMGKGGAVLKLEFIKKPIYMLLLLIGVKTSVLAIAWTMVIYEIYGSFINMYQLQKSVSISVIEQLRSVMNSIIISVSMFILLELLPISSISDLFQIIIKTIIGVVFYILVSILTHNESFQYLKEIIVKKKEKRSCESN